MNEQVKTYSEETHLERCNEKINRLYNDLKEGVLSIASDVNIKPKAKYIAFIHKTNFVDIVIRKSNLTLHINMKKGTLNDPRNAARDVSNWGNGDYEVILKEPSEITYTLQLIKQSYETN